jgi:hypothetical protein
VPGEYKASYGRTATRIVSSLQNVCKFLLRNEHNITEARRSVMENLTKDLIPEPENHSLKRKKVTVQPNGSVAEISGGTGVSPVL